jgi:chromosome segregation ATPase
LHILVVQLIKQPVKQLMAIPSVVQGLIETKDGRVFELDSHKGAAWVEAIGSFRFEPAGDGKPYTVRKEASGYWYGCRKVAGKVRKKYIGKSSDVSLVKLEEIAAALELPPVARVNKVAEVAQEVTQVAEVAQDRLTALELEVARLRKAFEALQEALPGKLESGDFAELPKVDSEVVEQLQNELSNLKTENEKLRADYNALLRSSTIVTKKLEQEVQELRSQAEAQKASWDELREELENSETIRGEVEAELTAVRSELADLKQKSATAGKDLPEVADVFNKLKGRRKKSKADLTDVEVILEIVEEVIAK